MTVRNHANRGSLNTNMCMVILWEATFCLFYKKGGKLWRLFIKLQIQRMK